jgi:hypothetical protein
VGQLGRQGASTAHILYAFRIPSRFLEASGAVVDTLFADELDLNLETDSLSAAPFTGAMRVRLLEVAPGAPRGWARASFIDSTLSQLPATDPDALAPDTVIAGAALARSIARVHFDLVPARIAGFDSVRVRGDSLDVNVVVEFESFATPGQGFLELPLADTAGRRRGHLVVFSNDRPDVAVLTAAPVRSRPLVELDAAYSPGTKVVVSDGVRLHTYLKFPPLRQAVPDSALVFAAELVLTQVDTLDGRAFGAGTHLGVVVPTDTSQIFSDATARRPVAFRAPLAAAPNSEVAILVTPYLFDIQEGNVPDRGMILRVSDEGIKARQFEFYGGAAAPALRPRLRIVWGVPADFAGGRR